MKVTLDQWSIGADNTNEPGCLKNHLAKLLAAYPALQLLIGDAIFAQRPLLEGLASDRHYTKRSGLADCFAALTNAALSILRLIHPPDQPLRATAESIQWFPRSILNRLGFAMK